MGKRAIIFCLFSASPALAQNNTAGSNCCTPHVGGGCDDPVCSETVIDFDTECLFAWDSYCVGWAEDLCGSLCGGGGCPGAGNCCSAHANPGCSDSTCCEQVCGRNATCCSGTWSETCAELAVDICDVCEPPIVCPMPGDCCAFNFTPGCDREECCNLICSVRGDEFCCRGNWDEVCARDAALYCANICACEQFGDMDEDGVIDLRDVADFQNCFDGRTVPIEDVCACGDYDADDDVDLVDYRVLHELLTSP